LKLKPRLGSLKINGTDTDGCAAYNFLLTFIANKPWAYLVLFPRKNDDFSQKFFSTPVYFALRWSGPR